MGAGGAEDPRVPQAGVLGGAFAAARATLTSSRHSASPEGLLSPSAALLMRQRPAAGGSSPAGRNILPGHLPHPVVACSVAEAEAPKPAFQQRPLGQVLSEAGKKALGGGIPGMVRDVRRLPTSARTRVHAWRQLQLPVLT